MTDYKTISENCYFKTGRKGVVFEALDLLKPNVFDDNTDINGSVFDKSSKLKVSIVSNGKACNFNIYPSEMLILSHLLSDGVPMVFKKRVSQYNSFDQATQASLKDIVNTFGGIDYNRLDSLLNLVKVKEEASAVFLQKNSRNYSAGPNSLFVTKFMLSYEDGINGSSKWKITLEEGIAEKAHGPLNIVKTGTYKRKKLLSMNLQANEIISFINEGAKRVLLAERSFYGLMKVKAMKFTEAKIENNDYKGTRIDEWNPQGIKKEVIFKPKKEEEKTEEVEEAEDRCNCSSCGKDIDENISNYSKKTFKKELCLDCQKKEKEKSSFSCSDCGVPIDANVKAFSEKKFGKELCIKCQKKN